MQKAFEQGAQLKRLQEERKAATAGRWRSGGSRRGRGTRGRPRGSRGRGRKRRRSGVSSSEGEDDHGAGQGDDMEGSDFEVFLDGDDSSPEVRWCMRVIAASVDGCVRMEPDGRTLTLCSPVMASLPCGVQWSVQLGLSGLCSSWWATKARIVFKMPTATLPLMFVM